MVLCIVNVIRYNVHFYLLLFLDVFNRKKKKDKEKKNLEQQVMTSQNEEEPTKGYVDKRTPAQMAFDKVQEKRVFI